MLVADDEAWARLAKVFRENGVPVMLKGEGRKETTFDVKPFKALPDALELAMPPSKPLQAPPSEVMSLSVKRWSLPSPTVTQTLSESSRIDAFTHEVKTFPVDPPGPYGKAVGMTSRNGTISVLTTGPVSLARYDNPVVGTSTKTVYDVEVRG